MLNQFRNKIQPASFFGVEDNNNIPQSIPFSPFYSTTKAIV